MTAALVVLAILVVVLGAAGVLLISRHRHHLRRQAGSTLPNRPAPAVHRHPRR